MLQSSGRDRDISPQAGSKGAPNLRQDKASALDHSPSVTRCNQPTSVCLVCLFVDDFWYSPAPAKPRTSLSLFYICAYMFRLFQTISTCHDHNIMNHIRLGTDRYRLFCGVPPEPQPMAQLPDLEIA